MSAVTIRVDGLSKMYTIGAAQKRHDTLRDGIASGVKRALGWGRRRDAATTEFWALKDVSFEIAEGDGGGHHRPQRCRQEHAAQDSVAHHDADGGSGRDPWSSRFSARGGYGFSLGAHRDARTST